MNVQLLRFLTSYLILSIQYIVLCGKKMFLFQGILYQALIADVISKILIGINAATDR